MATQIPDEMLRSGDLVDVEYLIKPGANPTLLGLAISNVKKDLWADKRFDYQGSREEIRTNKSGLDGGVREERILIITVSVRKYPRGERPELYQAGLHLGVAILLGLFAGAVIAYSGQLAYKTHTVKRIATDPNMSDAVKTAALEALGQSSASVGSGIAAVGGSLVTAAIIIGVLWALSLSKSRGQTD